MSFRALVEKSPAAETKTSVHDYHQTLARAGSPSSGSEYGRGGTVLPQKPLARADSAPRGRIALRLTQTTKYNKIQ